MTRCSQRLSRRSHAAARSGLNLIEVLAVSVLIGIVAMVALPRFSNSASQSRQKACYSLQGQIEVQVQLWYRNHASWPATNLSDIGVDRDYFPEGISTCPVDGSAYTIDAQTHQVIGHTH